MIIGAHSILYSRHPDSDRAFFRDVLGFPNIDAGDGWLIFGLPPSEIAFHPSTKNDVHELYLMCDDVTKFVEELKGRGVACGPIESLGWGILTRVKLPGGGNIGVYEPRHERPKPARIRKRATKPKTTGRTENRHA